MKSGFATLVGRPNVGKSTLLNAILGQKVSIVSDKVQTTRNQVRGVLNRPDAQVVFVDTPGIHKPRTLLGERLNDTATAAVGGVDVMVFVVDATAAVGKGDRFVAGAFLRARSAWSTRSMPRPRVQVLGQLQAAAGLGLDEYFPVSARTGEGVGPWSRPSSPGCRKARCSIPTTWSPTSPRRSGWPSWCASSCWR